MQTSAAVEFRRSRNSNTGCCPGGRLSTARSTTARVSLASSRSSRSPSQWLGADDQYPCSGPSKGAGSTTGPRGRRPRPQCLHLRAQLVPGRARVRLQLDGDDVGRQGVEVAADDQQVVEVDDTGAGLVHPCLDLLGVGHLRVAPEPVQSPGLTTPLGHGDEDDTLVGRVGVGKIERHVQRAIAQVLDVDAWRPVQPRQFIGDQEPEGSVPEPPVADPADEDTSRHQVTALGRLTLLHRRTSSRPASSCCRRWRCGPCRACTGRRTGLPGRYRSQ